LLSNNHRLVAVDVDGAGLEDASISSFRFQLTT
jgi:hypothetical protein